MKGWCFEHPFPFAPVSDSRDNSFICDFFIYFVLFDSSLTKSKQIMTLTTRILMYFLVFYFLCFVLFINLHT